jgi:hypothetical protein
LPFFYIKYKKIKTFILKMSIKIPMDPTPPTPAPAPASIQTNQLCSPDGKNITGSKSFWYSISNMFGAGKAYSNAGLAPGGAAEMQKSQQKLQTLINKIAIMSAKMEQKEITSLYDLMNNLSDDQTEHANYLGEIINDDEIIQKYILLGISTTIIMIIIFLFFN